MATNFPNSLQDMDATRGTANDKLSQPSHVTHHALEDDTLEALQAKVGIDNSAVTSSLDYKLTNASSISPGHKHVAADISDLLPISSSTGVADAGKLIKLDDNGEIDITFSSNQFGDGSDGDVTISSPTTLTHDMYYDNLIVNSTLTTDGYRIFVKGMISGTGTIDWGTANNGANGGVQSTGPAGGTQSGNGLYKNVAGGAGGRGGFATNWTADAGTAGAGGYIGSLGSAGGAGGAGNSGAGGGGASGTNLSKQNIGIEKYPTISVTELTSGGIIIRTPIGSGGGGGGGGGNNDGEDAGAGGGGGASGGIIIICAKKWSGTFTIKAVGGNGGNGGANDGGSDSGGGGGGAGGAGGTSIIVYATKDWTGSYNLAGGTAGAGGSVSGGGTQSAGTAGTAGLTGTYYEIPITQLI